jgi:hypothetical protein
MTTKIDDMIAQGAGRREVEDLPAIDVWPQLAPEAHHGLAGRIVKTIEPYSEADPVAILAHVLVATGQRRRSAPARPRRAHRPPVQRVRGHGWRQRERPQGAGMVDAAVPAQSGR